MYGNPDKMPVPEDTPHKPANVYGSSKAGAENVINAYVKNVTDSGTKDINAIMLRLSNVYGSAADHRERLIPAIMSNALAHRPIQIVGGDQNVSHSLGGHPDFSSTWSTFVTSSTGLLWQLIV